MDAYENSTSWTQYRDILKTRFGIVIARTPEETWRTVRGHEVHIDVWASRGRPKAR